MVICGLVIESKLNDMFRLKDNTILKNTFFLGTLFMLISLSGFSQNTEKQKQGYIEMFPNESKLTVIKEGTRFGNIRYLHSTTTELNKVSGTIAGLSNDALIGKAYGFSIAYDNPKNVRKDGMGAFSELKVNLTGKMDFDESSSSVYSFNFDSGIEVKRINGKSYSFGKSVCSWCSLKGSLQYCSVVPVYEASLNIGGENVKLVATSIDGNLEFNAKTDKLVIHKPRKEGDYYRNIKVYDVELGKPFLFGKGDLKSWYSLFWDDKIQMLKVKKSVSKMGYITANVDWEVVLKPGDISLSGKAGEKVELAVGKYSLYILTGYFGNTGVAEFDYHLSKSNSFGKKAPEINVSEGKMTVLDPLKKVETWFKYGWYKNELGVVLGFQNEHGAGNMFIQENGKQVKWNYELVDKESGELINSGDMHFG